MKRIQVHPGVYEPQWKVYVLGSLSMIGLVCLLPIAGLVWLYKKLTGTLNA